MKNIRLVIEVKGGNVQNVFSTSPDVEIDVMDWDNAESDENTRERCEELETETSTMNRVF